MFDFQKFIQTATFAVAAFASAWVWSAEQRLSRIEFALGIVSIPKIERSAANGR